MVTGDQGEHDEHSTDNARRSVRSSDTRGDRPQRARRAGRRRDHTDTDGGRLRRHCLGGRRAGPPHFSAGDRSGDYLWHDSHGFHLRVTHGSTHDRRIYSGEITASAPMRIDPVKLEKGDVAKLSANHRTLVFVFSNYGYVDGINFHTDCASTLVVKNLHIGNQNLSRDNVYLGKTKAHPKAIPFTVHRRPTTSTTPTTSA